MPVILRDRNKTTAPFDRGQLIDFGYGIGLEQNDDGQPIIAAAHMVSSLADRTGATNATTAFQDKIDEVAADLGGGAVGFPDGEFALDQVRLKSGVWLVGMSWRSRIKQRANQYTVVESGTSTGGNTTLSLNDTGAGWTADEHRLRSVRITSGPLAGEVRPIGEFHGTTQLLVEIPFSGTPGSVTYDILEPTPLIVLNADTDEFCGIANLRLDGNKANQTSYNDLIRLINTAGGPTLLDTHHLAQNVLGINCKGSGISIGANLREARFLNVTIQDAGLYGKRTIPFGGTDNWFIGCTFAGCGLTGVLGNGTGDHHIATKVFGNGQLHISGNGAGAIISQPSYWVLLNAEENWHRGLHIQATHSVDVTGLNTNANGGVAVTLDDCEDCRVEGVARSTAGMAYQTDWVLHLLNDADRNDVQINYRSADFAGGAIEPTGTVFSANRIILNGLQYTRDFNLGGEAGTDDNEHFVAGKDGAPATGNPYYTFKTSADDPPIASWQGFDGSVSKTFLRLDFGASVLRIGDPGTVAAELLFADGTAAAPSLAFSNDPDTGFYRHASNEVGITAGGAKIVGVTATQVALTSGVSLKVPGNTAGVLAVGGNLYNHVLAAFGFEGNPLDNIHQVAVYAAVHGNSFAAGAGSFVIGFESAIGTQPGSFTLERITNYMIAAVDKGAGTTITRTTGLGTNDETSGTHNAAIARWDDSFTGNWFIYYGGSRPSYFGGAVTIVDTLTGPPEIERSITSGYLRLWGGTVAAAGANIVIFGSTHASLPNQILISASGGLTFGNHDIRFDQALVALGGGAAPTLGTIGGSGPAAAAQNSWKKFIDSSGATFWVPVWK